ncbi:hypothetical protein JG687_00017471 [Phytophthora cactorum]|uniref:Uncharacterized protein n=1 Tax=Phytophthora cactorum TaxID=29920 RepID=A0A8T1TT58_9STRA|nr:hypothetical protein JG687_00017471 [Phytophthora cactorum]
MFEQKYFQSRQTLRSDLACVSLSYKWAAAEYNAKTGKAFREVNAASLLTNYHKWWTVLNPLVNLQQDAIVEGGLTIATEQPHHALPQAASGTVHLRGEDGGNQELDRRVRQRLNVESPILQGPKAEILLSPLGSTIATAETKSIALGTSGNAKSSGDGASTRPGDHDAESRRAFRRRCGVSSLATPSSSRQDATTGAWQQQRSSLG